MQYNCNNIASIIGNNERIGLDWQQMRPGFILFAITACLDCCTNAMYGGIEMTDYTLPKYDECRKWINSARRNGYTWEEIEYARKGTEEGLVRFLDYQRENNFGWDIDASDWYALVALQKKAEEETQQLIRAQQGGLIVGPGQLNALGIPTDPMSSWVLYKKHLLQNGFTEESVTRIEIKTGSILRCLKRDNPVPTDAVKGLVVGNVQSGKTANMAALMAMAADWGWNVFIILSGTIESLRQQTQSRMLTDLAVPGNISWVGLEHLSPRTIPTQRTQYLNFEDGAQQRYFTICLKNSSRLKNLIDWLQSDSKKAKQMRILVIDDEADQAGVNTAKIDAAERRKINKLIINLVEGNTSASKRAKEPYLCMNYIGYTATPYANILNEAGRESLYPASFIATLDVNNEYFGPQQIFGQEGNEGDGLDIVRVLPDDDLAEIKRIHTGESSVMPVTLEKAILWFLCSAACFRAWGLRKPVSMLIHTSQKTDHHQYVASIIQQWFNTHSTEEILSLCRTIWNQEVSRFDKQQLFEQYKDEQGNSYGRNPDQVPDFPEFDKIIPHLAVLSQAPKHIKLDDEQELTYHDGVHLCVDNYRNSRITGESDHIRLAYPDKRHMPELAPAFIVVGGATLSRGLTIEGLVSTFFVRSVSQADSLMQMGRWFGYRKGYEILPRIWMTEKTRRQFVFLSTLDYELRAEIKNMEVTGKTPRHYAVRVKNSPQVSFIRLTAKNKMQSAIDAEYDFTGVMSQTTLFDDDESIQGTNISLTRGFINTLPEPVVGFDNPHADNGLLWLGVPFDTIRTGFLEKFKFQERSQAFSNMEALTNWLAAVTSAGKLGAWNVKLAGRKDTGKVFETGHGNVGKVNRSQKINTQVEGLVDIGVLRDPRDMVSDIDVSQNESLRSKLVSFKANDIRSLRHEAGMDTTPLMVIYCIDKDSEARTARGERAQFRKDLNAKEDLIGICICIPGGKPDGSYATKVQIRLSDENMDGSSEVEDNE